MRHFLLLFLLLCSGGGILAQTSIFDELAKQEQGKGTVVIRQSATIRSLVGSNSIENRIETDGERSYLVMQGYRIQVFTDNNQRTARNEAETKKRQIEELFNVTAYVKYNAPFWRLYVGDYITYEEAFSMMNKIAEAFPTYKKEIQIKEEEIRIPFN
jgi:hypothetical protein